MPNHELADPDTRFEAFLRVKAGEPIFDDRVLFKNSVSYTFDVAQDGPAIRINSNYWLWNKQGTRYLVPAASAEELPLPDCEVCNATASQRFCGHYTCNDDYCLNRAHLFSGTPFLPDLDRDEASRILESGQAPSIAQQHFIQRVLYPNLSQTTLSQDEIQALMATGNFVAEQPALRLYDPNRNQLEMLCEELVEVYESGEVTRMLDVLGVMNEMVVIRIKGLLDEPKQKRGKKHGK